METGLPLLDGAWNRDRFRYNWGRAQMLSNPVYIKNRREKFDAAVEEKLAKEKKKADKALRDKEKLVEKEAKKAKKAKAREDKEKEQTLNKEIREKKRKESADKKGKRQAKRKAKPQ